jgi:hypothetical protein
MVQPSNTHPFEIPVDHPLTVHIDKAPCDVGKLREPRNRQRQVRAAGLELRTYEFKRIRILTCFHKLIDASIRHPVGHHRECGFGHCHPKGRQHVRMLKGLPWHEFPVEFLHGLQSAFQWLRGKQRVSLATHADSLL